MAALGGLLVGCSTGPQDASSPNTTVSGYISGGAAVNAH